MPALGGVLPEGKRLELGSSEERTWDAAWWGALRPWGCGPCTAGPQEQSLGLRRVEGRRWWRSLSSSIGDARLLLYLQKHGRLGDVRK